LFVTILRWTVGVIAALLAAGTLFGFAISVAFENEVWRERTRRLRAWLGVVALAWFNGEVWGRVVYTLVHWAG
jgi:predicted CDP-diglyceride synthetase/phosphatidate cytidylyltransferase